MVIQLAPITDQIGMGKVKFGDGSELEETRPDNLIYLPGET